MTAKISPLGSSDGRRVAVLTCDGMSAFETWIVTEVFGLRWPDIDVPPYDLRICADRPASVNVVGGATLTTPYGLDDLARADTVIVPSVSDRTGDSTPEVIAALRLAHSNRARLVSFCSGAFALAAAGLLDGLRATTHWRSADLRRRHYPRVDVDPKPLYVDAGRVLTSAGCAAGLDLCLHIVRRDHGGDVANAIARRLVIQPRRSGGQAQYIEAPVATDPDDDRITDSRQWALRHLTAPITLRTLADRAHMSPRTYLRQFRVRRGPARSDG